MKHTALALLFIAVVGCKSGEKSAPAVKPFAPVAPAVANESGLSGTVAEVLDVPTYTYLRLTTSSGEAWAAIPTTTVAVGDKVTLDNPQEMRGFASKTLGKTFDVIYFASGIVGKVAPQAQAVVPGLPTLPVRAEAKGPAAADEKVERVAGADGKSVAEVFAQKVALKDKTVAVRGKVVKVTSGVLGKNWLHLRDGSGSEATKDHDLVVTTSGTAAVGDTVVVRGAVHLDRDFGAGYAYAVIVEDATLNP